MFDQFIVTFTQGWVIKKRTSNDGGCCFFFVRLGQGGNNKIGQGLTQGHSFGGNKKYRASTLLELILGLIT